MPQTPSPSIRTIPPEAPLDLGSHGLFHWVITSTVCYKQRDGAVLQAPVYSTLGDGMYGRVFEVTKDGRTFAAKVIFLYEKSNPGMLSSDVLREIALYQELHDIYPNSFPHLPHFYGVKNHHVFSGFFADKYLHKCKRCTVLILERCRSSFRSFVCSCERITLSFIRFYVWQLLNGLAKIHSHGLSHRDLKPDNLLVSNIKNTQDYFLKISDLGMGRKIRQEFALSDAGANGQIEFFEEKSGKEEKPTNQSEHCNEPPEMQQTAVVITLPYRPPELLFADASMHEISGAHSAKYGKACDMWSAGVIFGELCLRPSYDSKSWKYLFYSRKYEGNYNGKIMMMITNIFKILGSPSESDCLKMKSIGKSQWSTIEPYVRSFPRLTELERLYSLENMINSHSGVKLDYYGLDLLSRLLDINPSTRLTAKDALAHPFFECLPYKQMNKVGFTCWMNYLENPKYHRYLKSYSKDQLQVWKSGGGSLKDTQLCLKMHQISNPAWKIRAARAASAAKIDNLCSASTSSLPVVKSLDEEAETKENVDTNTLKTKEMHEKAGSSKGSIRQAASTSLLPLVRQSPMKMKRKAEIPPESAVKKREKYVKLKEEEEEKENKESREKKEEKEEKEEKVNKLETKEEK